MFPSQLYLEPVNILLVDCADEVASVLTLPFSKQCIPPFVLTHVRSLEQAVLHLKNGRADVILIDLKLPDASGFEGILRVRELAANVPIIVLTDGDEETAMRAIQMGVQDYFVKDRLSLESLAHALICSIERQRLRGQLQQCNRDLQSGEARFRNLILKNADGIIVVDRNGVVRFINPAAERLLGRKADELMGEVFGFPILGKEKTEIDIFWYGPPETRVAEMRLVETEWEGEGAFLISLRDITEHRKTEEHLQEAQHFNRSILDSLDAHIAVVDEQGTIISVNKHWEWFAMRTDDVLLFGMGVGKNLFAAFQRVFGASSPLMEGITAVLKGKSEFFQTEYMHRTEEQSDLWFHIRISPLRNVKQRHLVVVHQDITEQKKAAQAEAEMKATIARIKAQEREIRGLIDLSSTASSVVTASMFGMVPLSKGSPLIFEELLDQYERMMDKAIEQRTYRIKYSLSDELRAMAERLGFLKAGPRDVIEIHSKVLQKKGKEANPVKAQAYTEESRLMVLELMGHLTSYYRNQSLGINKPPLQHQSTDKPPVEQEQQQSYE